ncbi:MAG: PQQ-binding-like beta-propeller repeat protein [Rubinisphaera brasiliensis]|uniref:PQQ-binding-like beta-propeller repeat protein n=1 Tax=Rubinisphaera brasiliensis TaxID=119 RepID=UPI00391B905E
MSARCGFLMVALWFLGAGLADAQAETFTGRVTKMTADGRSLTVYSTVGKSEETFTLSGRQVRITVNGRPAKPVDLSVGDLVTIFANSSGEAQRVIARSKKTPKQEMENPAAATADGGSGENTGESWSQFLGPKRENRSPETGLLKSWPEGGPKLLWTARNLGEGYSAVSVADGKVFTMGTREGQEIVLAFDLSNGQELWATRNGTVFSNNQGNGPRSTPTYEAGRLYCLGADGDLGVYSATSGQTFWQKNILSEFSASNIVWGISESPLIDGNKLVCTPGGAGATMVALNKANGDLVWRAAVPGNPKAGYASPILADLNGTRQYVNFCHNGLLGVDAVTGQPLWGDDNASNDTANCSSAIQVGDDSVFYASGYGTGGALLQFNDRRAKPQLVYKTEKMKNHHGGMVQVGDYIYGANEQILTCLEAKTGSVAWQDRLNSDGKGAITFADGQLYFRSEQGPMYLIDADPAEVRIRGQFEQPERSNQRAWARPVVADGKLFLRDQDILLCYDVSEQESGN